MNKIYLAGKITGDPNYKNKFNEKVLILKKLGYDEIINPSVIEEQEGLTWEYYMKMCIPELLSCQEIAFIEDWRESRGAIFEYDIAKRLKIPMWFFSGNTLISKPLQGIKFDSTKKDWSLLDLSLLEGLISVLMYGEKKYEAFNWQNVENGEQRYFSALMRHLKEYQEGKKYDDETGMSIIDHIICNAYFLKYFEVNNGTK